MNFNELFKQIPSEDICEKFNIFTLVGKDFYAVTAGKKEHYNSMAKIVPLRKVAKIALSITTDEDEYVSHEDMVKEKAMRVVSGPISAIAQSENTTE